MKTRSWIWVLIGVGLGLGLGAILAAANRPPEIDAHAIAEARLAAVEQAGVAVLPGAERLGVSTPSGITGERRSSRDLVTYALVHRRRQDLADVPRDDARGGPVAALLELAELQARALAVAGFQPMVAGWSSTGHEGRQRIEDLMGSELASDLSPPQPGKQFRPRVYVEDLRQSDSGGGGGTSQVDLNAPWITHFRIYLVPDSGATLFVKNRFDNALTVVDSEFAYADRTLFGVEYPRGSHLVGREPGQFQLREWIVQPDRR